MLALFTVCRRAHCSTIGGMECVCEHYSRCVIACTAAPLRVWNVSANIIHVVSSRAPQHYLGHGMCVCEHHSRCDVARTAALLMEMCARALCRKFYSSGVELDQKFTQSSHRPQKIYSLVVTNCKKVYSLVVIFRNQNLGSISSEQICISRDQETFQGPAGG